MIRNIFAPNTDTFSDVRASSIYVLFTLCTTPYRLSNPNRLKKISNQALIKAAVFLPDTDWATSICSEEYFISPHSGWKWPFPRFITEQLLLPWKGPYSPCSDILLRSSIGFGVEQSNTRRTRFTVCSAVKFTLLFRTCHYLTRKRGSPLPKPQQMTNTVSEVVLVILVH